MREPLGARAHGVARVRVFLRDHAYVLELLYDVHFQTVPLKPFHAQRRNHNNTKNKLLK